MSFIEEFIEINDYIYSILIGRNAKGNEDIIRISHQDSLWMHFSNISGPHIILQSNGDIIEKRYINLVANMLYKYKKNVPPNSKIIYTKVKNVKLTNELGTVIPTNIKYI